MPSSITSSFGVDPFVTATNSTSPFERNLYNKYEFINLAIHDILEEERQKYMRQLYIDCINTGMKEISEIESLLNKGIYIR